MTYRIFDFFASGGGMAIVQAERVVDAKMHLMVELHRFSGYKLSPVDMWVVAEWPVTRPVSYLSFA